MQSQTQLSSDVQQLFRCPICRAELRQAAERLECTNSDCAARFPIVNAIPVLINEQNSIFLIDDFVAHHKTYFGGTQNRLKSAVLRLTPRIGVNVKGKHNYKRFGEILLSRSKSPRVLVIGGSILGQGMDSLADHDAIEFVESDVSFGPRTMLIVDAHDIPFDDRSFEGVIVQAVLEHVVDPHRCVSEIHRVLKEEGVVYAETPFMQQVHGGRYDFTRFTHLGHRRLFRFFTEIDSGAACGPGMALAWSYQYFLMSFTKSRKVRKFLHLFTGLTSFFLKYFDYFLINKVGALDAASGLYFIGRKAHEPLSDRDLIRGYRGAG